MRVYVIDNLNCLKNFSKVPAYTHDSAYPQGHKPIGEIQKVATGFVPMIDGQEISDDGRICLSGSIFNIVEMSEALKRLAKAAQNQYKQNQFV